MTGLGVVTPLGCELDDVWDAVCRGESGVGTVERFDCRDFKVRFGGEIRQFDATKYLQIDVRDLRRADRFSQFAMVAAEKAVAQAAIDFNWSRFPCFLYF